MSMVADCLDFLERLGADAGLRDSEPAELTDSLARANIAPALWEATIAGNSQALTSILGADSPVCCLIAPAKEDEEEEEEEEETPDQEEEEDEDAGARNVAAASASRTR